MPVPLLLLLPAPLLLSAAIANGVRSHCSSSSNSSNSQQQQCFAACRVVWRVAVEWLTPEEGGMVWM